MPSMPVPKGEAAVLRSLQKVGRRSLERAQGELADYHRTQSGRVVVLSFGGEGDTPPKRVYLDHLDGTFWAAALPVGTAFRVVAKKSSKRPPGVKFARSRSKNPPTRTDSEALTGKASSKIPKPVRDFTIYFVVNIRKIICPSGKKKVDLSAAATGVIGALAVWLVRTFGITGEVASAFASAVLITIATATKGAFCDMTAEMAKLALKRV
jgi:hypothetical protein